MKGKERTLHDNNFSEQAFSIFGKGLGKESSLYVGIWGASRRGFSRSEMRNNGMVLVANVGWQSMEFFGIWVYHAFV